MCASQNCTHTRISPTTLVTELLYSRVYSCAALPIIEFYKYLWTTNRSLLYYSLFVNYAFPILLEAAPWYFSRRLLASKLRDMKNTINHNLIAGKSSESGSLSLYTLLTIIYAAIHTLDQILKNRVQLAQKLVIKRLVVERILFSEIGSLERKFKLLFGTSSVRPDQLEVRVFRDINDTLHLFNFTLPTLFRGMWTVIMQSRELYKQRGVIDILAIGRPAVVTIIQEGLDYALDQAVDLRRTEALERMSMDMSQLVSTVVDGLVEIQVNNMQRQQLRLMDSMADQEMTTSHGMTTFFERVYKTVNNRSVLDFVSEVIVVKKVMARKGIDHERYRKIQNDIDYVFKLLRRNVSLVRQCVRVLQTQSRVIELVNLPSFADEAAASARLRNANEVFGQSNGLDHASGRKLSSVAGLLRQKLLLAQIHASRRSADAVASSSMTAGPIVAVDAHTADSDASRISTTSSPRVQTLPDELCLLTDFHELRVRSVQFSYEPGAPLALDIQPPPATPDSDARDSECDADNLPPPPDHDCEFWAEESLLPTDMQILPGQIYGLIGQV